MYADFIIRRPVLAVVLSVIIVIAGVVCMKVLPVALYPDITPPTVTVTAVYPGANAQTLSDTVAQPIEDQINGVEGMQYMSSTCSADGTYTLTVTFEVGRDLDMCQVLVQNRVTQAEPKLPQEVTQQGITVEKKSTQFVLMAGLTSSDGQYDDLYLNNYATINLRDSLSRVPGVGEVDVLGVGDYSMRIWLDPEQLKHRRLSVEDVIGAIREQNVQVAAGIIGQPPVAEDVPFQYTVTCQGRLQTEEEFENIILRATSSGQTVYLKDVASVALGAKTYATDCRLNGEPASVIMIYQLPTANTVEVAERCRAVLDQLQSRFPKGVEYTICYDGSWYIDASIKEIYKTLISAVVLVVLIVFVFLQDWRASLIPTICIPVSLIGTFAAMAMFGFSINTLTLFGLVLAIGVVVDDSIVVVENTQRHIDSGRPPKEAASQSLREVIGPCIATTLTLLAVFVPTAFVPGLTGRMYRQFAMTVSASTIISTINALTLSPVLCSILLRPGDQRRKKNVLFRGFDWLFGAVENGYHAVVKRLVRCVLIMLLLFAGVVGLMGLGFMELPTGFIPTEDQGYFMANIQLPDAASLPRTREVSQRVGTMLGEIPGVRNVIIADGMSFLTGSTASNYSSAFVFLDQWADRKTAELQIDAILQQAVAQFGTIQEAQVIPIVPPPIQGIGNSGGFSLELEDQGALGVDALQQIADDIVAQANDSASLQSVFTSFRASVPQLHVAFQKTKIMTTGLEMSDVYNTLQGELGGYYVNDFNAFGRTYQVNIQSDSAFRARPGDIAALWQRNELGEMIPMNAITRTDRSAGAQVIYRYNMFPATMITGSPAPGVSSGQAMAEIQQIAQQNMPDAMGTEWTGMSFQQVIGGASTVMIFALGAVFVYLFLAAQYESFLLPIAVLMSVPFALIGALGLTFVFGLDNNLYTQIGIVLLIGLASKTSILIVEFAKKKHEEEGMDRWEAAAVASKLRFRAILMTAFSDIFGWMPLVVASGAGAQSRVSLGVAVLGGMIVACGIGILFVPSFYVGVQWLGDWMAKRKATKLETA